MSFAVLLYLQLARAMGLGDAPAQRAMGDAHRQNEIDRRPAACAAVVSITAPHETLSKKPDRRSAFPTHARAAFLDSVGVQR
jgi:hypothetical protein